MSVVICHRVEGSFLSWELALFLVPYVDICYMILSSICSLIYFCGVVDSCGEIIIYVVYLVSCVRISFLPAIRCCGYSCSVVLLVQTDV
jgi:hypothetical protein